AAAGGRAQRHFVGAVDQRAGDDDEQVAPGALELRPPGLADALGHRRDQHLPDDGVVLRFHAVVVEPRAERSKPRNRRVEHGEKLPKGEEASEQLLHELRVLPEEEPDGLGRTREEPKGEHVPQLVSPPANLFEALLECFHVHAAASSSAALAPSIIAPATMPNASAQAVSYSGRHASPAISAIDAIRTSPTTG